MRGRQTEPGRRAAWAAMLLALGALGPLGPGARRAPAAERGDGDAGEVFARLTPEEAGARPSAPAGSRPAVPAAPEQAPVGNLPDEVYRLEVPEGAPPPEARAFAYVDKTTVTVGEMITLTVAVNHAPGVEVTLPDVERMNRFEVVPGVVDDVQAAADDRVVTIRRYQLQAFYPDDDYRIPAIPVQYVGVSGLAHRQRTAAIPIVVTSIIPPGVEPDGIRDIKGIPEPPETIPLRGLAVALAMILAGAALATYLVFRRRRREQARAKAAHEIALEEIVALEERDLLGKGEFLEHFRELSRIYRDYLTRRYRVPARFRTSEELDEELERMPWFGEHSVEITRRIMQATDRVKFARLDPSEPQARTSGNDLLYLLDLTRELPAEPEREGER